MARDRCGVDSAAVCISSFRSSPVETQVALLRKSKLWARLPAAQRNRYLLSDATDYPQSTSGFALQLNAFIDQFIEVTS